MSKRREFWLIEDDTPAGEWTAGANWYTHKIYADDNPRQIHAIEKSAYDKAVEALKRYHKNWCDDYKQMIFEDMEQTLKELGEIE